MAFFDSFTDSIKQKWLQFFQSNRDWIILQMTIESVYTPDGGKRPSSYLILGVVNALEPKLAQLMFPFAKLNPDADTLIDVLGLHFDPDITLGNRLSPLHEPETYSHASPEVTEEVSQPQPSVDDDFSMDEEPAVNDFKMDVVEDKNSFDSMSFSEDKMEEEFQPPVNLETEDDFGEMSFDAVNLAADSMTEDFQPPVDLETEDDFGEMSFETVDLSADTNNLGGFDLSDENEFAELNQPDDNEFRDVISDVWGDEGEDNNTLLGEELPSEVFDESEMARLFPNN
ncbi:MAG: hypothetical protein EAZ76_11540 [Nostocales cyanobacterium]|nr:MAG: hypothetical protein EAZ87_14605 [Nostocales cyanobacterium]TAF13518.1 MAG: hypothetical protein EAZ76_11540 [Nostocales cyanobacterium]